MLVIYNYIWLNIPRLVTFSENGRGFFSPLPFRKYNMVVFMRAHDIPLLRLILEAICGLRLCYPLIGGTNKLCARSSVGLNCLIGSL